ncbi:MAG: hypothetical protein GC165_07490 [Armatimonadetes bacterium]|nr:hypothetical protein [Armatimonadota bacterium]
MSGLVQPAVFAVYTFTAGPAHRKDDELSTVNGKDFFVTLSDILRSSIGSVAGDRTFTDLVEVATIPNDRYIYGFIEHGFHGERRRVVNIDSHANNKNIERNESALDSYFFSFYIPKKGTQGAMMLQQRGIVCNTSFILGRVKKPLLKDGLIFRPLRVAPLDLPDKIKQSNLKKITFTKRIRDGFGFGNLAELGSMKEISRITVSVEPHAKGTLNSFLGMLKSKKEGVSFSSVSEFVPDTARFTMDMNGKQVTVLSDIEAVGKPTFEGQIEMDDNGFKLQSLLDYAKTISEATLSL